MAQTDVTLVFSEQTPEPERADWIASELRKQGIRVVCRQYRADDDLLELLHRLKDTHHVAVLFSRATSEKAGHAFVRFRLSGRHPLPVRCDSSPKYALIADIVHVDIFGAEEADATQLMKLAHAILRTA